MTELHDSRLPPIGEHRGANEHVGLLDVEENVEQVVLGEGEFDDDTPLPLSTFRKLLGATLTLTALIGVSYAVPFEWAQPWRVGEDYVPYWNIIGRELMGQGEQAEQAKAEAERMAELAAAAEAEENLEPVRDRDVVTPPPSKDEPVVYPEYAGHEDDQEAVEQPLENLAALADFYATLTATDIGYAGAVTHVGHWGDSVLGLDGITASIRRRIQSRFGDAGHGWHAITQYDSSYRQQGVRFSEKGHWSDCFIRNRCMQEDGRYGYGGVTAWSSGGGESWYATATEGPIGLSVGRFEVWYQQRYKGGKLKITIDGGASEADVRMIDTAIPLPAGVESLPVGEQPEPIDTRVVIDVPDGPHEFSIRAAGGGKVRLYGVVLEREQPGVVWDGMALIGAFTSRLGEQNPEHLARQFELRDIDLMVFTFGGNDMTRDQSDLRRTMDPYVEDYTQVLQLFRKAKPDAACLIMGPVDHGERIDGRVVSRDVVARMTEAQRQVATEQGCAFFDTLAAMGGEGAISRWKSEGLISGDLAHPTSRGHKLLGAMVYRALMAGYAEFRRANAGKPMVVERAK
ncbi:GDSL-type esterase/lipase family protein [Nannocystaceae bacterium ST9]